MLWLRPYWPLVMVCLSAGLLYADVARGLVSDWYHDDNYSHGFLIVPLAAYFVWERRDQLRTTVPSPSTAGLGVVLLGLGMLIAGILGAEFFLSRVSLLVVLAGTIVFLLGWSHLRILALPIAFLVLMVPIPAIIFNQVAFPLQLFASRFGVAVMELFAVPVLREGNVITLANTTLEVAEACSGIRSLISLLTLGIVYGYFTDSRTWVRVVIAASTVPIAILANGLRVAGTGVLAHRYGIEAAMGFFHTFSGWIVFLAAFGMLFVTVWAIRQLAPEPLPTVSSAQVA